MEPQSHLDFGFSIVVLLRRRAQPTLHVVRNDFVRIHVKKIRIKSFLNAVGDRTYLAWMGKSGLLGRYGHDANERAGRPRGSQDDYDVQDECA